MDRENKSDQFWKTVLCFILSAVQSLIMVTKSLRREHYLQALSRDYSQSFMAMNRRWYEKVQTLAGTVGSRPLPTTFSFVPFNVWHILCNHCFHLWNEI